MSKGYWAHDISTKNGPYGQTPDGNYRPNGPEVWNPGNTKASRVADRLLGRKAGKPRGRRAK